MEQRNRTLEDIDSTLANIDDHFHRTYQNASDYERMLTRAVKLSEEVGELCEAVLHENGEQRREKTDIDFGGEVADVIICTLMLARTKHVDVWGEVERKLQKILDRVGVS